MTQDTGAIAPVLISRMDMRSPEEALAEFVDQKPLLTPAFVRSLDIPHMGFLSRNELLVNHIKEIVEDTVDEGYYPELRGGPAGTDEHIAAFIEKWREEEIVHSEVLGQVREAATPPSLDISVRRLPYQANSPFWYKLLGPGTSIALQMTWGALNEALTYAVYRRMAEKTDNLTYRRLLEEGIAPEELKHKAFYRSVACWYLDGNRARQLVVSAILKLKWQGVGADIVPRLHRDFLTSYLFEGKEAWFRKSVGDFIRRVPGMEGFYGPENILRSAGLAVT